MKATRSIERALSIFEAFRLKRKPLRLKEISEITELSKATLLRHLDTMESEGYIVSNNNEKTYFLSPIFLDLSNVVLDNYDLRTVARPMMEIIKMECNETVNLYIMNGINRICIDQVVSDQMIKKYSKIGDILPLYSGSSGKLFLAFSSKEFIDSVVEKTGLKPFTQNTITSLDELNKELQKIKKDGYSTSYGEREEDIISVAVPIFNHLNEIIAALTISGPSYRLEKNMDFLIALILDKSRGISFN